MTITEFLLARIAEDADRARTFLADNHEALKRAGAPWPSMALAGVERVLAECAAKRAIIEMCPEVSPAHKGIEVEMGHGEPDPDLGEQILRTLATIYADHPDYQPEWKPDTPSEAG